MSFSNRISTDYILTSLIVSNCKMWMAITYITQAAKRQRPSIDKRTIGIAVVIILSLDGTDFPRMSSADDGMAGSKTCEEPLRLEMTGAIPAVRQLIWSVSKLEAVYL